MKVTATILFFLLAILSPIFGYAIGQDNKKAKRPLSEARSRNKDSSNKGISITSLRIRSQPLVEILNYASVQDLNSEPERREEELRLRLYTVPKEGDCVQDSHYVCSKHYYLAVTTYEEGLGESVYDLGEVGEISDIQWLKSDAHLTARLRIAVTNYPKESFKQNQGLVKREKKYDLRITLNSLSVTPAK